jgi:hypothetical protein
LSEIDTDEFAIFKNTTLQTAPLQLYQAEVAGFHFAIDEFPISEIAFGEVAMIKRRAGERVMLEIFSTQALFAPMDL